MKMKRLYLVLALALIIATLGCVAQSDAAAGNERFTKIASEEADGGEYIYVYHDNVNNVTIYAWEETMGYGFSGMSAIPDWQLEEPNGSV